MRSYCLQVAAMAVAMTAIPGTQGATLATEVRSIVDRALARSAWWDEQGIRTAFCHVVTQRTRTFDGSGEVIEDNTLGYAAEPFRQVPYYRVIARNDKPISDPDREFQKARWRKFLDEVEIGARPDARDGDVLDREKPHAMIVNEDLLARYTLTLVRNIEVRGRSTWVLEFQPRTGKLPVRHRLDHALNNAHGEIWIDQDTYEVARVNFQLTKRVRWLWGIFGSISDATGYIERHRVADDIWMPLQVDIYFHMRVLFRTTRRSETTTWSDFRSTADALDASEIDVDGTEPWMDLSDALCRPGIDRASTAE